MKYELQTIPVWEALRTDSECLLCTLMREAEDHAVSYYLGSSVMHPETRVEVNKTGFCLHHWDLLLEANRAQPLALFGHTYLQETKEALQAAFCAVRKAKAGRKTAAAVQTLHHAMETREAGCLICDKMQQRLDRYAYTTVHLWRQDPEFRTALKQSKGVCLHHMEILLDMALSTMPAQEGKEFCAELVSIMEVRLERIDQDTWWMTQKYKSENFDKPWNGCEDAHKRLVRTLCGEGRIRT
jgi:hypothetical protein